MNRYEIYQMCLRKKVFADVASAKKCAAKTTQIQLYVYRCKVCLGFHVTSKPPENVKKRYLTSKLIYDGIEISSEDETYYYIQQTDENEHLLHRGWRKLHGGNPLFWKKKSTVHREIRNRERKKYLAESDLSVSDQSEKPILLNESPRSETMKYKTGAAQK